VIEPHTDDADKTREDKETEEMTKTRYVVLAAALAMVSPAVAAAAETYRVDADHANVDFQVRHFMSQVSGAFNTFEGTIVIDREEPEASSVEFTIQANSIDTNNDRRDEHLRSPDFFDVASHPIITFESTSMTKVGEDSYEVTGDFTMRGVTRSITLPVQVLGEMKDPWGNQRIGFETSTTIDRKEYGVSWNQTLDQGGLILGDDVKVSINLQAVESRPDAD
jgi:polyisoprenoid-binding protein YceI